MCRRFNYLPGCQNCACGNHRGCTEFGRPPWRRVSGIAKDGCPCIKADDERIAQEDADEKAAEDEEKSAKRRLLAVEMALWGKTYEGSLTTRRPKARTVSLKKEIKLAASSKKKRRLA